MERIVYDRMAELDQQHWWYRARREVLAALIRRRAMPPKDAQVLEIGCGTGHNLAMLGQFGRVSAVELDPAARAVAETRLGRPVGSAPLPKLDTSTSLGRSTSSNISRTMPPLSPASRGG
jgi:protein-L-isoaspartate O-methyltransferase